MSVYERSTSIEQLEREVAALSRTLDGRTNELETLKVGHTNLVQDHQQLQNAEAALRRQLIAEQSQQATLDTTSASLRASHAHVLSQLEAHERTIADLRSALSQSSRTNERVEEQLNFSRQVQKRLELDSKEVKAQHQALLTKHGALQNEHFALQSLHDRQSLSTSVASTSRSQHSSAAEDVSSTSVISNATPAVGDNTSLRLAHAKEVRTLQEDHDLTKSRLKTLTAENLRLENERMSIRRSTESEIGRLKGELADTVVDVERMQNYIQTMEASDTSKAEQLDKLSAQVALLQESSRLSAEDLRVCRIEIDEKEDEIQVLKVEAEMAQEELTKTQQALQRLSKRDRDSQQILQKATDVEIASMVPLPDSDLQEMQEVAAAEIHRLIQMVERLRDERDDLKRTLDFMEAESRTALDKATIQTTARTDQDLSNELQALHQQIHQLTNKLVNTERDLELSHARAEKQSIIQDTQDIRHVSTLHKRRASHQLQETPAKREVTNGKQLSLEEETDRSFDILDDYLEAFQHDQTSTPDAQEDIPSVETSIHQSEFEAKLARRRAQIGRHQSEIRRLESKRLADAAVASEQLQELHGSLAELQKEKDLLASEVQEERSVRASLEADIQLAKNSVAILEQDVARLTDQICRHELSKNAEMPLESQRLALIKVIFELKAGLISSKLETQKMRTKHELDLTAVRVDGDETRTHLQSQLMERESTLRHTEAIVARLESEKGVLLAASERPQTEQTTLGLVQTIFSILTKQQTTQLQNVRLRKTNKDSLSKLVALTLEAESIRQAHLSLQASQDATEVVNANLVRQHEADQSRLEDLQVKELTPLREAQDILQAQLATYKSDLSEQTSLLAAESQALKAANEDLQAARNEAEATLTKLNDTTASLTDSTATQEMVRAELKGALNDLDNARKQYDETGKENQATIDRLTTSLSDSETSHGQQRDLIQSLQSELAKAHGNSPNDSSSSLSRLRQLTIDLHRSQAANPAAFDATSLQAETDIEGMLRDWSEWSAELEGRYEGQLTAQEELEDRLMDVMGRNKKLQNQGELLRKTVRVRTETIRDLTSKLQALSGADDGDSTPKATAAVPIPASAGGGENDQRATNQVSAVGKGKVVGGPEVRRVPLGVKVPAAVTGLGTDPSLAVRTEVFRD